MTFALNYSPAAAALVRAGVLDIDRFKCPDWADLIAEARALRPVYVHFPLLAGDPAAPLPRLEEVGALRSSTGTPFVNMHLNPRPAGDGARALAAAVARAVADVARLTKHFGDERVVVENVPYWRQVDDHHPVASDPLTLRHVVQETGCGLLLDLAHARIACLEQELDVYDYLEALPVEHLRELHVTGLAYEDGRLFDHQPMTPADMDLFAWALDRIRAGDWARPRLVACEYGGVGPRFARRSDPAVLARDVPRLLELVHEARPRHAAA